MIDERDERLFERAGESLRAASPRDDEALADVIAAIRHEAAMGGDVVDSIDGTGRRATRRRRRPLMTRGTARFIAGLAAGIAFAGGLGLGISAGWRMRGASYRLAAEDVQRGERLAVTPP